MYKDVSISAKGGRNNDTAQKNYVWERTATSPVIAKKN